MPKTANETFRDFFLRRQHFIQRYENGVLRDMALSFRQAYPELQARMLNLQNVIPAPGTGFTQQFRIQRMRAQLADMQGIMNTAAINSSNHLQQALADFAHLENQSIAAMYAQNFGKVNIPFTQLPFRHIESILQEPLIWQRRGIGIADVMLENVDKAMAQIRGELTQSIILGDDMAQAAKRLTGTVGRFTGLVAKPLQRRTEVIARSEIQNVAAQVSRQITAENADVIKSVIFVSTLDSRTCRICTSLDGTVKRVDPETGTHGGVQIPVHPMCRCLWVQQSYSWQELAKRHDVPFDKSQKAFFDGAVTKTITYDAWLRTLPETGIGSQVEILGPARQKLWSSGQIKLSQMATSKRILTIEQLEAIAERELGKRSILKTQGGRIFKEEADAVTYNSYFDRFAKEKLTHIKMREIIEDEMDLMRIAFGSGWKVNTNASAPSAVKFLIQKIERKGTKAWIKEGITTKATIEKHITEEFKDQYLKLRALQQARFKQRKLKELKLNRGTDGEKTGPGMRSKAEKLKRKVIKAGGVWEKEKIEMIENSLVGYTHDLRTADSFGKNSFKNGVTVTRKVKVEDVVIDWDNIFSITRNADELEIMVLGGKQEIALGDLSWKPFFGE